MNKKGLDNAKLGLFVVAGLAFMILMLYMIGKNRNLFGTTIRVSAHFHNINGLVPGNNVRFSGIDVGTVSKINMVSDTSVEVSMLIDKEISGFIKMNSVASVGTDGLMGNKLININSRPGDSRPIQEGSIILTVKPVETDEMLRTLDETNQTISGITQDLKNITQKIGSSNGLWRALSDTGMSRDLRLTVSNLRTTGEMAAAAATQAAELMKRVNRGEGLVGTLVKDTVIYSKLKTTMANIEVATVRAKQITLDLDQLVKDLKQGHGAAGILLTDTAMARQLKRTMTNVEQGTAKFNEDMEALKHNFLTRGYFKDQEKEAKKAQKDKPKK